MRKLNIYSISACIMPKSIKTKKKNKFQKGDQKERRESFQKKLSLLSIFSLKMLI
jgi:hypothetical protein